MHILINFIRLLPFLSNLTKIPKLIYKLMIDPRVPIKYKILIPGALLYLMSPIDLIRDFIPILGYFDDILIILLAIMFFVGKASKKIIANSNDNKQKNSVIVNDYKIIDDEDEQQGDNLQ
tara:strand:- start:244 stop:603 length:360 start_codon:yes stop_codon:yes gene_type:complete